MQNVKHNFVYHRKILVVIPRRMKKAYQYSGHVYFSAGTPFGLYAVVVHIIITTAVVLLLLPVHVEGGAPKEQLGMSALCVMRPFICGLRAFFRCLFLYRVRGQKILVTAFRALLRAIYYI